MGRFNQEPPKPARRVWNRWGLDYITPMVKYLLIANVAIFILQILFTRQPGNDLVKDQVPEEAWDQLLKEVPRNISVVQEWMELDTQKVLYQGQIWRLVTYSFCHDRNSVFHILFNMLGLYWFGIAIESMIGKKEFLAFYVTGAIVSGLAHIGIQLYLKDFNPAIGASGAVMAVLMMYALHFPRSKVWIFGIWPLEMRWIVLFYIIIDLHPILLALSGERLYSQVAHAAHLGGLAFGLIYWKFHLRLTQWSFPWKRKAKVKFIPFTEDNAVLAHPMLVQWKKRVQEIRRKVEKEGMENLTEEERKILAEEDFKNS